MKALRVIKVPLLGFWTFELLLEPRDAWVGLFWDRRPSAVHFYMCPAPFVVLHLWKDAPCNCLQCALMNARKKGVVTEVVNPLALELGIAR